VTVTTPGETPTDPAERPAPRGGGAMMGSGLVTAGRAAAQLSSLVLLIVAARVLTPAELAAFGLVSITGLVLQHAAETSWFEKISGYRRDAPIPPECFWVAAACGAAASVLGLCIAAGIQLATGSSEHALVMAILSPVAVLGPLVCVQTGVLAREERMAGFGAAGILGETVGLAVGVYGLLNGWNVFALAAHRLTTIGVVALVAFGLARWLPPVRWRANEVADMVRFYGNLVNARAVTFVHTLGVDYLAAIYLGLTTTGYFRAGNRISGSAAEMLNEPARIMAWSILPKTRQGPNAEVEGPKAVASFMLVLLTIASPVFVGVMLVAEPLVHVILGPGWETAAVVLAMSAVARLAWGPLTTVAYAVMGMDNQFRAMMRFNVIMLISSLGFLAAVGWMGLGWVLGAQVLAGVVLGAEALRLCVKYGKVDLRRMAPDVARVAASVAIMAAVVWGVGRLAAAWDEPARLAAMVAAGAVAYLAAILLARPAPVTLVLHAIARRRHKP
jgi:O-antigen/teichoic acid export membrane protein